MRLSGSGAFDQRTKAEPAEEINKKSYGFVAGERRGAKHKIGARAGG
jgi:hypothetical protein